MTCRQAATGYCATGRLGPVIPALRGDRGVIGDVDLLRKRAFEPLRGSLCLSPVDIPERHLGTRRDETFGNGEADAARAAGDNGDAAFEIDPIHRDSFPMCR